MHTHCCRLDALDPNAYAAFQASNDLRDVVDRVKEVGVVSGGAAKPSLSKKLSVRANLMTPVKPMLVRETVSCLGRRGGGGEGVGLPS